MPASAVLLLRVAATWPLPGLGLLALPAGPTPLLTAYPLHTALAVQATTPNGSCYAALATVEEIARTGTTERGLLLEFSRATPASLLPGTEIRLAEAGLELGMFD